jgi:hypothetical protein
MVIDVCAPDADRVHGREGAPETGVRKYSQLPSAENDGESTESTAI